VGHFRDCLFRNATQVRTVSAPPEGPRISQAQRRCCGRSETVPNVVRVRDVNDLTQAELDVMAKTKTEGGVVLIPEAVWAETAPARPWWKFWGRRG
jgi:hypothetical protein